MRRGFKTEANAHAVTLRRELKLQAHAPLCPWKLAEYLEIPVFPLSQLAGHEPSAVDYLLGAGKDHFSAVTIFAGRHGRKRVVFHNDGHSQARQASNLAHELAHAILCHPPTSPFVVDSQAEEEASWMGPSLLISNEAAIHILEIRMAASLAEEEYNVSSKLLRMRLDASGARIRMMRRAKKN